MKTALALFGLLALAPAAFADDPQMYKWTDAQGTVHYSDQPPKEAVADLTSSDIPVFPAVDQVKLDKEQAALLAQAAALQQLAQAQAAAQADARAAAAQLAALQAPSVVPAAEESYSPAPIYVASAFVPRSYRRNLYVPYRPAAHSVASQRPLPSRPAISILQKP
jgi:hypothetical protein